MQSQRSATDAAGRSAGRVRSGRTVFIVSPTRVVGTPRGVAWWALTTGVALLPVVGQAQTVEWARSAGGTAFDTGTDIAVDAGGNSYVTGNFTGTATFGSFTLISAGDTDAFVAKYNKRGDLLWARSSGGISTDGSSGIAVDAGGNSYVTGSFVGTAQFGSFNITSAGDFDIFLAKYDTNGNVLWVVPNGGISAEFATDIALDATGNIFVTGQYRDTATFGPFSLISQGGNDIFVAKFDGGGSVLWARSGGGTGVKDEGRAIAVDDIGNSYVTGRFNGMAAFGSFAITSAGATDAYVAKYDPSGNVLWVRSGGGALDDYAFDVAVDAVGNSYITGGYLDAASFGPFSLASAGTTDIYVAKYDSSGNVLWARTAGGAGSGEVGNGIGVDAFGNSYITGTYSSTNAFFGPFTIRSAGRSDIFVAHYDAGGNVLWVRSVGGAMHERGLGISVTAAGNSYVTGQFGFPDGGTATFGPFSVTSAGDRDIYVAKFAAAPASQITIPTVSAWGLIVMALLLLLAGTKVCFNRRRPARA